MLPGDPISTAVAKQVLLHPMDAMAVIGGTSGEKVALLLRLSHCPVPPIEKEYTAIGGETFHPPAPCLLLWALRLGWCQAITASSESALLHFHNTVTDGEAFRWPWLK